MRLRPFADADRDLLLEWRNHPDVARWMYTDRIITPEEHAPWFEAVRHDGPDHAHRILEVDGAACAVVSLTAIADDRSTGEWGGYVVPGRAGQGHGTAALALSLALAFDSLGLAEVRIEAFADNDRAVSLYQGVGFRRDPTFERVVPRNGRSREVVGLTMTRSDWEHARSAIMERVTSPEAPR